MQKLYLYIFAFLFTPSVIQAQELNYVHYDTKDGLAGSTVYVMCQDKDGFIWFGTENGLSRFDGTRFKNFTVQDGLPDNEIIELSLDSLGRLWIMSFKNEACYYYQGKIHNKDNDSLIARLDITSRVESVTQDPEGNIMISDEKCITFIKPDGTIKKIADIRNEPNSKPGTVGSRYDHHAKKFRLLIHDSIFYYKDDRLIFVGHREPAISRTIIPIIINPDNTTYKIHIKDPYIKIQGKDPYTTNINTSNGAWTVDIPNKTLGKHYLPGKKISYTLEDSEGGLWFATLGEGVYKLSSGETKTIKFSSPDDRINNEVFTLAKHEGKLLCGLSFSKLALVDPDKTFKVMDLGNEILRSANQVTTNRLYYAKTLSSGATLLGFDSYLAMLKKDKLSFLDIMPIKAIEEIDNDMALVATSGRTYKVSISTFTVIDSIWNTRSTRLFYQDGIYYIGTLNGLYAVKDDKTSVFLGDKEPLFKRRIGDMKALPDKTMFIATQDEGVVIYKDGKTIGRITESNGLSSNICRALFLQDNFLWIGTNKGLNKVDVSKSGYPVLKYSTSDGLPSDIINAVYTEDSIIWVGTPAGLTYFNENRISGSSICKLKMESSVVSGKEQPLDSNYHLSYKDNNISFEYAGISFKSGGDIVYHYKLDGLDKEWKETKQSNLTYQSLPSGEYELHLYAVNKFGKKSETLRIKFNISTPFWKEWWFYGLLFFGAVTLTTWLLNRRNKTIHAAREEKSRTQQQFAALEQQALQAQMNPHFIFNCLNSIQQYILTNDKEKANQYLTGFATLIRQTLDNSGKRTITVAEEVTYLTRYLDMEEMRFGDNFAYEIVVDKSVKPELTEMPALLLQPYVENCLRHGIRYKLHGTGKVSISFTVIDDVLYCRIKDNGVGRKKADELKSWQHIEYQSKGMRLTEKRIELLNKINKNHVSAEIIDLTDENGVAAGTEVIVKIPLDSYE